MRNYIAEEEERKGRQRYQQYKQEVQNTNVNTNPHPQKNFDIKGYEEDRKNRAQRLEQQRIKDVNDIANGVGVPIALREADERLSKIDKNTRAAMENQVMNGSKGLKGLGEQTKIWEKSGLTEDEFAAALKDVKKFADYKKSVAKGNVKDYMSSDQYLLYAQNQIDNLPKDLKKDLDLYREKYVAGNTGKGILGIGHDKYLDVNARKAEAEANDIAKQFLNNHPEYDKKTLEKYLKYQSELGDRDVSVENNKTVAINPEDNKFKAGVRNTGIYALNAPRKMLDSTMAFAGQNARKLIGAPSDYNAYGKYNRAANLSSEANSQVLNNAIREDNKLGKELYMAGTSVIDMMSTALVSGGLNPGAIGEKAAEAGTLALFGTNAFNDSMNQAKRKGLTDEQAFDVASADAAIEVLTELVGVDNLYSFIGNGSDRFLSFLGKQMLAEGTEEGIGKIAKRAMEYFIVGEDGLSEQDERIQRAMLLHPEMSEEEAKAEAENEFFNELWQEMRVGGLSGGIMGVGGGAISATANYASNYGTNREILADRQEMSNAYQAEADENEGETAEDKMLKEQALRYAKNPVRAQVDMMDDSTTESKIRKAEAMEISNKLDNGKKLSMKDNIKLKELLDADRYESGFERYKQYSREAATFTNGITEREAREKLIDAANNGSAEELANIYDQMKNSSSESVRNNADEIFNEIVGKAESNGVTSEQIESARITTKQAYDAGYRGIEVNNLVTDAQKEAINRGKQAKIQEKAEQIKQYSESYTDENVASLFIENAPDSVAPNHYADAFNRIYHAAEQGTSFETIKNNPSVALLGEEVAEKIHTAGLISYENGMRVERARIAADMLKVHKASGVFKNNTNSKLDFYAGEIIAATTGLDLVVENQLENNARADFDSSTSTIRVAKGKYTQMTHELLGEFTEFYASTEYKEACDAALELARSQMTEKEFEGWSERVYHKDYSKYRKDQTRYDTSREMANDVIAALMKEEPAQEKFANKLVEMYGSVEGEHIMQKFYHFYKKVLDSLRSIFANSKMNDFQKKMLNAELDKKNEVIDKFLLAYEKAVQNYRVFEEAEGTKVATTDGTKRLSVATYEDGGRELLERYLKEESGLSEMDQLDILDQLDNGYKVAKTMLNKNELASFSNWSKTKLVVAPDGTPLLKMYNADGRPIKSVVVNNGEYPLNIDYSQVCKKRIALNTVLNKLIADTDFNLNVLTESDINDINSLIKEHGFEIACGLCFVDSKRYRVGEWSNSFVEGKFDKNGRKHQKGWNDLVKSILPKGVSAEYFNFATTHEKPVGTLLSEIPEDQLNWKTIDKMLQGFVKEDGSLGQKIQNGKKKNPTELVRMAYLIKNNPECRMLMDKHDIEASEGLDALRERNYPLYKLVNAHWGAGKPKLSHGFTAYGNDILESMKWGKKNDFSPENSWRVGGVRVQSFSDYVANMFFDYMQMFADMSARRLPSHAYTKEVNYVKIFGLTGQKINMSLVPRAAMLTKEQQERYEKLGKRGVKAILNDPEFAALAEHAGLDENGNYIWEDETFPYADAMDLRKTDGYKDNCGTIAVGVSNAHIRKLLADPNIDMVIPYHSSGVSQLIKKARNIALYTDYQNVQNTRNQNGEAMKNDHFDWYSRLKSENNPNGLEAKEVAQEYLDYCKENGYTPKFDEFVDDPNYYKLLIDFRAYDDNGNFQQQNAVKAKYPENLAEIVEASLKEQQATEDRMDVEMSDEQNSLYEAVKKMLKEKGTLVDETSSRRMSLEVDSEENSLSDGQKEYFKNSKIVDENGALKIMYHGTKESFTIFDPLKLGGLNGTAEGYGLYFADTPEVSKAYGNNVMKGYLNITNPARFDQKNIKQNDLAKLIKATCEKEAQSLMEDGYDSIKDAIKDTWISNYVDTYSMSIEQAYKEAARSILGMNSSDMDIIQEVMAGMAIRNYASAYEFYDTLTDTLGIDGFIAEWEDTNTGKKTEVAVALYSNQFKNIDNQNPTSNPDIRYSLGVDITDKFEVSDLQDYDFNVEFDKNDRKSVIRACKGNIKKFNAGTDLGDNAIENKYIGIINVNRDGITHGLKRQYKAEDADAIAFLPLHLYNAIPVNEADGVRKGAEKSIVLLGMYTDRDNAIFTRIVVNQFSKDVEEVHYLYAVNNKKEDSVGTPTEDLSPLLSSNSTVKDFLNVVKNYFPNELPSKLADELGIKQSESVISGLKYSLDVDSELMDDAFVESLIDDDLDGLFTEEELKLFDKPNWSVSDLMQTLAEEIEKAPDKKRKEAIKHLTRKALGDQFKTDGKRVSFTDERIDSYLDQFASTNNDYAQAYITYMSPADYMLLTANGKNGSQTFDRLMSESHEFNEEEFKASIKYQPIFLDIDQDNKITRVVGHEGRHRMIALQLAGYTQIPVLLFNYSNKYSKAYIPSMTLRPQDFSGDSNYNKSNYVSLSDIEPLSRGNADNVKAKFGSNSNADIRYSLDVETPLEIASDIYEFAFSLDDYGTLDAVGYDSQTEIDAIANDIANGKTDYWINTLEDIILDSDENSEEAKRLLNALNRITDGRRYALDFDEDDFALFENNNPVIGDKSILEEGLKALKGKAVNTKAINKIAAELKTEFASTIDKKEFADMLTRAFGYLHTRDNITFNDVMALFSEVARPVIDSATKVENADLYNEFTDYFRGKKIKLSDTQMAEVKSVYGSYAEFQKAVYPLQFSTKGDTTLDSMWYSLAEQFPGLVEYDTTEGDMPVAINDLVEALRPSPTNTFGADAEEVGKDLAMRIVESYLSTESDAKIKKLAEKMRASEMDYRKQVRDRYREKYNKAKEDLKNTLDARRVAEKQRQMDAKKKADDALLVEQWEGAKKLHETKTRYEDLIADIKAKSKDTMTTYKDRQDAKQQKRMIAEIVNDLTTRITNPTEKKHVPQSMIKPLMELLQTFNFVEPEIRYNAKTGMYEATMLDYNEKNADGKNVNHMLLLQGKTRGDVLSQFYAELDDGKGSQNQKRWQEKLGEIKKLFDKVNLDGENSDVLNMLDATMADSLEDLLQRNDNQLSINNLSTEDLITVKNALRNISKAINEQNKAFTMNQDIDDTAHDIQKNGQKYRKDRSSLFIKGHDVFIMNMMSPDTYFTMLGEKGKGIYKAFQDALDKKIKYIQQSSKYMEDTLDGIDKRIIRNWSGDKAEIHTFNVADGEVKMTTAQIMSLYELSKRQQAMGHIMSGGITVEKLNVGWKKINLIQDRGIHLTVDELANIISTLTPEQMAIADAMQRYMATESAKQGNEASLRMYGFEKYLDGEYFPITTASDSVNSKNEDGNQKTLNGIERMGFTKAVAKNAGNPIVVKDIFDVFVDHTVNMATYAAYAPVIKDALRIYNYKDVEDVNGSKYYMTVKQALNACMGRSDDAGRNYFENLIRDINGSERAKTLQTGADAFAGHYKAAAVGGNLRVVVQQPTAFVRAGVVIEPKYLAQAVPRLFTNVSRMNELKEKVPLIYWKSQGYYETNVGRSEKAIITGVDSISDKVTEASMWMAGKADDITWATLYDAAERQIKAENPGLTGEEFDKKVIDLFNKAIHETQVVDATVMKAPWLRMNDKGLKLMSSFMAEPIKSYNIALKSILQASRGEIAKKAVVYSVGVLVATDMLNALAQALVDGLRYHDDDEEYLEEVLNYWLPNFIDNVNPIGRIPFVKDMFEQLVSTLKGDNTYGRNGSGQLYEYAAASSMFNALGTLKKQIDGTYNKTNYAAYMDYTRALSQITGMPLYNMSRDAVALWNMFTPSDLNLQKNIEKPSDKYNNIITVLDKERSDEYLNEAVKKALEKNGTVKDIKSKLSSAYKQDYLEALENGDDSAEDLYNKAVRGYMAVGLSQVDAEAEVESWTDVTVGYSDLDKAIINGDGIQLATKIVMDNKDTDKILDHIYNTFGATIEYNRMKGYSSDIEDNVNKVLNMVDGSDYDELSEDQIAKAEERAEKKAKTEANAERKTKLFTAIDSGGDYKSAVDEMAKSGMEYKDIKSAITSQYKDAFVSAYKTGDRQKATQIKNRVAAVKAYCDKKSGLNIAKKYNGNYLQYELDHVDEWLK